MVYPWAGLRLLNTLDNVEVLLGRENSGSAIWREDILEPNTLSMRTNTGP
jgi:hypothetical protein